MAAIIKRIPITKDLFLIDTSRIGVFPPMSPEMTKTWIDGLKEAMSVPLMSIEEVVGHNPQAALAKDLKRRYKVRYPTSQHEERRDLLSKD